MSRPFTMRVTSSDWLRGAEAWIAERLAERGVSQTGPVEQQRVRPWSTQLLVPTEAGRVWFKANCPAMAYEMELHAELARLVPSSVDAPWAVDGDHGWMLTADRGTTLGESHAPTIDDWRGVLAEAARVQRDLVAHRDVLLATGIPDCSPATVVDRFDRLVASFEELPAGHPSHVSPELGRRLRAKRPEIIDASQLLVGSAIASTWQHGDLHPWNVFAVDRGGALRIFDFGDAQWAHALEILSVPYGWITSMSQLSWPAVLDAYCEQWPLDPTELTPAWEATWLTQPVNRAITWLSALEEATAEEWHEWGEAPLHHLSRVLDP